jgi:hypothetical protein
MAHRSAFCALPRPIILQGWVIVRFDSYLPTEHLITYYYAACRLYQLFVSRHERRARSLEIDAVKIVGGKTVGVVWQRSDEVSCQLTEPTEHRGRGFDGERKRAKRSMASLMLRTVNAHDRNSSGHVGVHGQCPFASPLWLH